VDNFICVLLCLFRVYQENEVLLFHYFDPMKTVYPNLIQQKNCLYWLNRTSVDFQENYENCCYEMSDFKAKMHHLYSLVRYKVTFSVFHFFIAFRCWVPNESRSVSADGSLFRWWFAKLCWSLIPLWIKNAATAARPIQRPFSRLTRLMPEKSPGKSAEIAAVVFSQLGCPF